MNLKTKAIKEKSARSQVKRTRLVGRTRKLFWCPNIPESMARCLRRCLSTFRRRERCNRTPLIFSGQVNFFFFFRSPSIPTGVPVDHYCLASFN